MKDENEQQIEATKHLRAKKMNEYVIDEEKAENTYTQIPISGEEESLEEVPEVIDSSSSTEYKKRMNLIFEESAEDIEYEPSMMTMTTSRKEEEQENTLSEYSSALEKAASVDNVFENDGGELVIPTDFEVVIPMDFKELQDEERTDTPKLSRETEKTMQKKDHEKSNER